MLITNVEKLGYAVIEAAESIAGLKILQSRARLGLLTCAFGLPCAPPSPSV
ncbi:hypothetical protein [Caballeronia sp. CLC5]|uniref:hypothetical protein n=1 Tax=Caballeronia sp. CLC5 TaxID=2906764 RepID=UPI001F17283E|nr:hypothetical protein [Caballeronia sp. CLC5]MCE4575009.1 hypothetical protein [Caballeronia sp. CLC5]